jgi:phospholipase C
VVRESLAMTGTKISESDLSQLLAIAFLLVCGLAAFAPVPAQASAQRAPTWVSLSVSPHRVPAEQAVLFTGRVSPNHAHETIFLQQRSKGRWHQIGHGHLSPRSTFKIRRRLHGVGPLELRARLPADATSRAGVSPKRKLIVLPGPRGIHKIQHVVIIMQENRSFDSYFGTYPGADGPPPGTCVPDPATGQCVAPYHDHRDANNGGLHNEAGAIADLDGGRMDGFITEVEKIQGCRTPGTPQCYTDVMGYHDPREIPNYWAYARSFVLQDHMFEPNGSWSLPQHLFLLSGWSARCALPNDPFSCVNALNDPGTQDSNPNDPLEGPQPDFAWTDLTYLLHRAGVSWGYYVNQGIQPDCANGAIRCANAPTQSAATPGIWNPLPGFTTVREDRQLGNVQDTASFLAAAQQGALPAVSWLIPNQETSEHPPALVSAGQAYVTSLINAVMRSPEWGSTAIFLTWDDWGGFYDHMVPPLIDGNGYGFRVPGLVISPYAKTGYIDHQVLSHDAYNKFIEDDFLGSQRLDPATDGRPDPRPDVREAAPQLGNLAQDFDFHQRPRPPLILP